jgi:abortive infection bacteriophage resistance protein
VFDRKLRLLVLDAIERIEVSVRSQWAYHLAHDYGSHAHLNSSLFNLAFWQRNSDDLSKEVRRSQEIFVRHFQANYTEPLPPVWVVCEVMPFGLLSRWFKSSPTPVKSTIAKTYELRANLLESWLHHLATIRNICAHHSRLWNREFIVVPQLVTSSRHTLANQFVTNSRKIYNTLVILLYLTDKISSDQQWRSQMLKLLNEVPQLLAVMDFSRDWQELDIWQN